MGIRVACGKETSIQTAIQNGIIPKDSIIITNDDQHKAELMFYDAAANLRHIVARTQFASCDEAIAYALANSLAGQIVTVLKDGAYTTCVVQPDFSLQEVGMGRFQPETIEELVSGMEMLKQASHTHANGTLLDAITEERMLKWDTGIVDTSSLPTATDGEKGVVKGTSGENGVSVLDDGTMMVNSVNISKLVQDEGDALVLQCGTAKQETVT